MIAKVIPLHLSYDNLSSRQAREWNCLYRWVTPPKQRWYFEGNRAIRGQLWVADRKMIYETVRRARPGIVFEVGTWKGGGSTYFIARALRDNARGILHTIELDRRLYEEAIASYEKHAPHLLPYVRFHYGASTAVYPEILRESGLDLLFLDGIGAEQTLSEFLLFEPHFRGKGIVISHDWNDEKTRLLRPYLESSAKWKQLFVLEPPASVGLAAYELQIENEGEIH